MATHQLGPESPRPFAVLSEDYTKEIKLPCFSDKELYSFGEPYEKTIAALTSQYLELNTDDRLCYVGQPQGSLAPILQDRYCLLKPITTVLPGHIHYQETPNHKNVAIKIGNVGAEEFFREEAKKEAQFDKVLLKDSLQYFTDHKQAFVNIMKTVKPDGRVLIVHRPAEMNTLPLFADAKTRLHMIDHSYMQVIKDLQDLYYDIQWQIHCLPIVMPKIKWYAMLNKKYPTQLEVISNMDVRLGIRELSEGIMKYEGEMVEFNDRLLFITASHSGYSMYPQIQRYGANPVKPFPGMTDLRYSMEATDDIKPYVRQLQNKEASQLTARQERIRSMNRSSIFPSPND